MSNGWKDKQSSSSARRFTCRVKREVERCRGSEAGRSKCRRIEKSRGVLEAIHATYHPSITAASAVKVNPIAMPIHGVWPREPSLRAWRTCRAASMRISSVGRSRSPNEAICSRGTRSGNETAGELCAKSEERLVSDAAGCCDPAKTAGARKARKVVGFMARNG